MDPKDVWKTTLAELELSVSRAIYQTHFSQSSLLSFKNNVATIGLPNPLVRTLVETRYYSLIKSVLDHHSQTNTSLVFVVNQKKHSLSDKEAGPLFSEPHVGAVGGYRVAAARRVHIHPEFTFETFAVSTTNQIAYAAASAVAKSPGAAYNPLFFYGGVGVGKTHLVHAIANFVLAKKASAKIVYCAGEEFLNDIIEAIQTKSVRIFKQRYRSAELLLVDDVQFIAGKQTAQEEFFHTFNAVLREGGQVILTSDRSPAEISRLEDRLRSRFEGGLMVDISPPDFELRAAIVNIKSRAMSLDISIDAARVIAANLTDTRAIEGFLKRLATEVSTHNTPLTPDVVTTLLSARSPSTNGHSPQTKRRVTPQEILEAVSSYYQIKPTTMKGPKRDRPVARPRQLVMYLCKVELGLTLEDIGGLLGGRDHTTIMHGVDTITHELPTNEQMREAIAGIKQKLWVSKI